MKWKINGLKDKFERKDIMGNKTITLDYQEFKDMEYELSLLRNLMDMQETEEGSKIIKKIALSKEYITSILKDYNLTATDDMEIILE